MGGNIISGAEPFELRGSDIGILLLHGWTSTPSQLKELAEALYERLGVSVSCPLYAGHGTTPEEMYQTTWEDWNKTAFDALERLKQRCSRVYVAGLSIGGLLTLHSGAHYDVDAIISINAPIKIWNRKAKLAGLKKLFRRWEMVGEPEPGVGKYPDIGYGRIPLSAVQGLLKCISHLKKDLSKIDCPTLIMQTKDDETVRPVSARLIYRKVRGRPKRLVWIKQGGHVATVSSNRAEVFARIEEFIKEDIEIDTYNNSISREQNN